MQFGWISDDGCTRDECIHPIMIPDNVKWKCDTCQAMWTPMTPGIHLYPDRATIYVFSKRE
jgi:hypothetical protein